jgi:Polyketide cyclase / dehydrase and lipid transport
VAVQAARDIIIDAPSEVIMEALADIGSVPLWSTVHKRAEVIDTYPDGRARLAKVTVKVIGIVDQQLLEFHWGPDWMVWDAVKTVHQHSQHVEYTLQREDENRTRVRFEITLEPSAPLPEFLVNRARKKVLSSATEGLRDFVMNRVSGDREGGGAGRSGSPPSG